MKNRASSLMCALSALALAGLTWTLPGSGRIARAAPEATGTITGRVLAADGGAVGQVTVTARPGEIATTTDAAGYYTLTLPANTHYTLFFSPVGSKSYLLPASYSDTNDLPADGVRSMPDTILKVGAIVMGSVVDGETYLPITAYALELPVANSCCTLPAHVDVWRGVLNPTQQPISPGTYVIGQQIIQVNARTQNTVHLLYPSARGIQRILTIPGKPNMLGIFFGNYTLPVLYSVDSGRMWQYIWLPNEARVSQQVLIDSLRDVALTPKSATSPDLRTVLARGFDGYADGRPINPTTDVPLARSGDNGEIWANASMTPTNCTNLPIDDALPNTVWGAMRFSDVLVSPRQTHRLYARGSCERMNNGGTADQTLYISDDFGETWARRGVMPPYAAPFTPSRVEDNRLFYFYNSYFPRYGLKVGASRDTGNTWDTYDTNLTYWPVDSATTDGVLTNTLFAIAQQRNETAPGIVNLIPRFVFSHDGGHIWAERPHPCDQDTDTSPRLHAMLGKQAHLLLDCVNTDHRSRDGGLTWQTLPLTGTLFVDYANPSRVYMTRGYAVWASDNEGDTWRPVWNKLGTGTLQGRISAQDGGAVGRVVVYASPGGYSITTNLDGTYSLKLPINPDGYELTAAPVLGESYLIGKSTVAHIGLQENEVRTEVNLTLSVGGVLAGTLLDAKTSLPLTTYGLALEENTTKLLASVDVVRGALNPQRAAIPSGNYQVTAMFGVPDIAITSRKTTTVALQYVDSNGVQSVLTIPGMPNFIGLKYDNLRKPMRYSPDSGRTWHTVWQPEAYLGDDANLNSKKWVAAFTRRNALDAGLRAFLVLGDMAVRTGDEGETWADADAPPKTCLLKQPWLLGVTRAVQIRVSPRNARHLYTFGQCTATLDGLTFSESQLYVNDNYGVDVDWQLRATFPAQDNVQWTPSLTEDNRLFYLHNLGDSIIIGTNNDYSQTWVTQTTNLTRSHGSITSLVADGALLNTLYHTTLTQDLNPSSHVWASNDAGVTWAEVAHPCGNGNGNASLLAVLGKVKHLLMDCLDEDYRSQDGGLSWQKIVPKTTGFNLFVDYANPGRIYKSVDQNLWVSDDFGDTWRPVWNVPGARKQFMPIVRA